MRGRNGIGPPEIDLSQAGMPEPHGARGDPGRVRKMSASTDPAPLNVVCAVHIGDGCATWIPKWEAAGCGVYVSPAAIVWDRAIGIIRMDDHSESKYSEHMNGAINLVLSTRTECHWVAISARRDFPEPPPIAPNTIVDECENPLGGTNGVILAYEVMYVGREFCQRHYGGRGPLWPELDSMQDARRQLVNAANESNSLLRFHAGHKA